MPFVKPNPDKKLEDGTLVQVFDNVRKDFLPEDGRMVPANAYWNRMLQRGDVVAVAPPEPEPVADTPPETPAADEAPAVEAKSTKKSAAKSKTKTE